VRETALSESLDQSPRFVELSHDMERHYLNAHYIFEAPPGEATAVPPLASLKAGLKRRAGRFIIGTLERYFADEREFMGHLVRFQNNIAENHDHLAREVSRLHNAYRVELLSLKQRVALLDEIVREREADPAASPRAPLAT
jgi:hypothetical protein